jgi:hypothetical protein
VKAFDSLLCALWGLSVVNLVSKGVAPAHVALMVLSVGIVLLGIVRPPHRTLMLSTSVLLLLIADVLRLSLERGGAVVVAVIFSFGVLLTLLLSIVSASQEVSQTNHEDNK